jgi:hypothetical protein
MRADHQHREHTKENISVRHERRRPWNTTTLRRPTVITSAVTASAVIAAALVVPSALAGPSVPAPKAARPNVAVLRPVTGTAPCRGDEAAAKAVNGSVSAGRGDKWCSGAATKTLQVDLGVDTTIGQVVVRHAGAGGESTSYNTRAFDIAVSADGSRFTTAAQVRDNAAAVTEHPVASIRARYVRLSVVQAEQRRQGGAARIYELEVYAAPAPAPTRTTTAAPSPSASTTASPTASPTPSRTGPPTATPPPNTATCFPTRRTTRRRHRARR